MNSDEGHLGLHLGSGNITDIAVLAEDRGGLERGGDHECIGGTTGVEITDVIEHARLDVFAEMEVGVTVAAIEVIVAAVAIQADFS